MLIRFTGPEVWWVLRVAHWASGVPAATVPVAAGLPGVLLVGGATVFTVALALVSRGHVQNDGGGRHMSACLVAVRAGRPFVTPSWGERG